MATIHSYAKDSVLLELNNTTGIAHLILNRPRSLNAINVDLLSGFVRALQDVKVVISPKFQIFQITVCILSGSGSSFCSGEDLKETLAPASNGTNAQELRRALLQLQEVTRLMAGSETIFIACVQGWAVGGGLEFALAADLVIAGPTAKFRLPEIDHGHSPTGGLCARLPQIVGLLQAKRLMLLGDTVDAQQALSMNLVTEVTEDPHARSLALAAQLSKKSKRSLGSIKRGLELATFPHADTVLQAEVDAASWCFADPTALDAFVKFRNRQKKPSVINYAENKQQAVVPIQVKERQLIHQTLSALLYDASTLHGEQTFLRFGDVDISYAAFAQDVARLAAGLYNIGIRSGDVVCALMFNSAQMVRAWFATMWLGAIWAPLHTEYRGVVLDRVLSMLSPTLLICDEDLLSALPSSLSIKVVIQGEPGSRESLASLMAVDGIPPSPQLPTDTACLLMTSGSTGLSKACELSHQYFLTVADALIFSVGLRSNDVLFCPFPLCHADATSLTVIPALRLGCIAAISRRFSASKWWDEIRQTKATVADFMGATLSILYKRPAEPSDMDNPLRLMWGVPVPVWVEDFERRFGLRIIELYGATESGIPVAQRLDKPKIISSCGVALPGIEIRIADDEGNELPSGTAGEIIVKKNYHMFTGYYRNPEATKKTVRGEWFLTGDIGRLDQEGNLYFIGRKSQVVRRRGENISIFEVEESILLHPDVLQCAAFGVPSSLTEEDLAIAIVKRPGSMLTANDLRDYAERNMTKFHVPQFIDFVDEIPRTATGKTEGFRLREKWLETQKAKIG